MASELSASENKKNASCSFSMITRLYYFHLRWSCCKFIDILITAALKLRSDRLLVIMCAYWFSNFFFSFTLNCFFFCCWFPLTTFIHSFIDDTRWLKSLLALIRDFLLCRTFIMKDSCCFLSFSVVGCSSKRGFMSMKQWFLLFYELTSDGDSHQPVYIDVRNLMRSGNATIIQPLLSIC